MEMVTMVTGTLSPVYGLWILCCIGPQSSALDIKVGALFTTNRCCDFRSFEDKASALNIAVDQLVKDGFLDNKTVSFKYFWGDSYAESEAVGLAIRFIFDDDVDVIFGHPQSRSAIPVAHITTRYNLPHVSWLSNSLTLSNKTTFRTFVRTFGLLSNVGQLVATLHERFGWQRSGLLYANKELCSYIVTGLQEKFAEYNMTFTQTTFFSEYLVLTDDVIDGFLMEMKFTSRIIYICDYYGIRPFMIRACHLGMCNGDYVFIYPWLFTPVNDEWRRGDQYDSIAKEAYKYVIHISVGIWLGESGKQQMTDFYAAVLDRLSEPPWNTTIAQSLDLPAGEHVSHLYDAMYLYGLWINHTLSRGLDHRNGAAWLQFAKNKSFSGMGGPCDIDKNGDKVPFFWIYQFLGEDSTAVKVAESAEKNTKITLLRDFEWRTSDGLPPRDFPECGMFHELCPPPPVEDNSTVVLVVCLVVLIFVTGALTTGCVFRRRKVEKELLQRIWRIDIKDLEPVRPRSVMGPRMLMRSSRASHRTFSAASTYSETDSTSRHSLFDASKVTVNAATYKGQLVVIKTVPPKTILTNEDLQDLKTMREFMHDNINSFVGACFDTASPCILFLYCPKGSLQDILENEEIQLDLNFKLSLTMDLLQGMLYIHNSHLCSHGRLKSSNCLVDNRWMLKITDYGVARFLGNNDSNDTEEQQLYKSLLWTAPELLARFPCPAKGTKPGDVYSIGIILHEIFYRMGPFAGNGFLNTKDIISRVKGREHSPCRPAIFVDQQDIYPEVVKLMTMCWHDNEHERPSLPQMRAFIKKHIKQAAAVNIVDLVLKRLEKYSTNLEDMVDQRTKQLLHEKQKSDRLLYRLLPEVLAEKLKSGVKVTPEVFESATLFFSDIVGFTKIAARSSPMEVVTLLNDLYVCLDSLIGKYDAYKVETIGDAYLVVSGIPSRNGQRHAGIIADMSLDILRAVSEFRIPHLPEEELNIRIGNHTGPCCAGIVGTSMPRYCLFGDTVIIASKMESHGSTQRIHISESTHLALQHLGRYDTEYRSEIQLQNKGVVKTYWLLGKRRCQC